MFYNPAMAFDRDLNVAVARALSSIEPKRTGWEMLGATGVRGLRVAHESEWLRSLLITEREPRAVAVIDRSLSELGLTTVRVREADARVVPPEAPFDYVDLDPYGSPLPYLEALFGSLSLPAVVGVTATDLMVLAGVVRGACEARYGARPLHGRLAPEGGLRILLATLAQRARARGAWMKPLLCYIHDHHLRAYVEVIAEPGHDENDPVALVETSRWPGPVLGPRPAYGPMWLGPLFDRRLVDRLETPPSAANAKEVGAWIQRVRGEAEVDRPFFYEPNELARALGLKEPPPMEAILGALRASGAAASRAHPHPSAFRTDAPRSVVEALARSVATSR